MTPALRPRRRRELPVEALRPASSVPRLRTRSRLQLTQQPVFRRAGSLIWALLLALGAHASLAWWGLGGASVAADVVVRSESGAALEFQLQLPTGGLPAEHASTRTPLDWPEPPPGPQLDMSLAEAPARGREVVRHEPAPRSPYESWRVTARVVEIIPLPDEQTVALADDHTAALAEEPPSMEPPALAPAVGTASQPEPLADNPAPHYPGVARRRGWEGRVVVRAAVDARGHAIDVHILSSCGRSVLDEAALDAVREWRFEPARDASGVARPGERDVFVRFSLIGESVAHE